MKPAEEFVLSRHRHLGQLSFLNTSGKNEPTPGLTASQPFPEEKEAVMEVVHLVCCGIDVHRQSLTACLRRVDATGTVAKEVATFGTMYRELLRLSDWLVEGHCPIVVMESTGVYWRPVYHVLTGNVEVLLANPHEVRQRRGKKTDKADAEWLAELLAHGLVTPSFIPTPEISTLRDLTRMRTGLVQTRTQAKNRVLKVLEDTNLKVGDVVSDVFGVSGRRMLDALVAGERDPVVLAEMALRKLRSKIPALQLALEGSFTEHHGWLIQMSLDMVDMANRQIHEMDERIGKLLEPLSSQAAQLATIPGVSEQAARVILSEIGADMSRFGSPQRLASWAGMCPGNNESAGKRRSGRTRKGNKHLRRVLVECAWATVRTDSFLGRTFRRHRARIGGKTAAVAVGHKILVIVYHLLAEGSVYDGERYDRPDPKEEARRISRAVQALARLGYEVELKKAV